MLSKRLQTILEQMKGPVSADIGCDHGLLACAAIQQGKAKRIYACDLRKGPLARAKEAVERFGLNDKEEQVVLLLQDGIPATEEKLDEVVIAGMGGETIVRILEKAPESARQARLLLSPHSRPEELRAWLNEHSIPVSREIIIHEDRRHYPLLIIENGLQPQNAFSPADTFYYGLPEWNEKTASWLEEERKKWQAISVHHPEPDSEPHQRMTEIERLFTQHSKRKEDHTDV